MFKSTTLPWYVTMFKTGFIMEQAAKHNTSATFWSDVVN